jgi:hypothetical protein
MSSFMLTYVRYKYRPEEMNTNKKNSSFAYFVFICRHRAIVTPLAPRANSMTITAVLVTVWVVSALISLPPAIYSTLVPIGG